MKRKLDLNLNTNEINSNEKQLPKIPPGSLGSLKNGIQSIPLQVYNYKLLRNISFNIYYYYYHRFNHF